MSTYKLNREINFLKSRWLIILKKRALRLGLSASPPSPTTTLTHLANRFLQGHTWRTVEGVWPLCLVHLVTNLHVVWVVHYVLYHVLQHRVTRKDRSGRPLNCCTPPTADSALITLMWLISRWCLLNEQLDDACYGILV